MRVLVVLGFVLGGCTSILGISDPVANNAGDPDAAVDADDAPDAGPRELVAIAIAPDPFTLPLGATRALRVIGMFSDASTEDLTTQATFALDAGTAVSVTADGKVRGLAQGGATIRATLDPFADTIEATVGPPGPDHLLLSLGNVTLMQQQRVQVHATIVFSDGTKQDGTTSVTWTSDDPAIASVVAGRVDAQTQQGTATITASASGVTPASLAATVSILACHPVINEVQAGDSGASDEFVEIYNPCTVPIDVTNWTLNYRAASNISATDTNLLITLAGTMVPGELRVFGADGFDDGALDGSWGGGLMQANNGGLGLRSGPSSTGTLVDAMAYGVVAAGHPFVETTAAPGLDDGVSVQRRPFDGHDTNDGGANFQLAQIPSPRLLNAP